MNKSWSALAVLVATLGVSGHVLADNPWSAKDYDLYAGDYDGDGLSDVLYISRSAKRLNGIALSDGSGFNVALQSWGNAYLGIPWSSGAYNIIVADFDGDARDDLFLQRRTAGDHYVLLTENGGIGGIYQTIPQDAIGLVWSADFHAIVAGDFNGDRQADLFLQATAADGVNAVVLADSNGQFTATTPLQSWNNGYAGFNWTTSEARVFSGDFNGDGLGDLLLQAEPLAGTGPGTDVWAVFPPNMNGVVLARNGERPFATEGVQAWNEDGLGAHWSPLRSALVVADFNADRRSDVLLQGITASDTSYLLYGHTPGAIFESARALDAKSMPTSNQMRLIPGRFSFASFDALYFQSLDASKPNFIGSVSSAGVSIATSDVPLALTVDSDAASGGSSAGSAPAGGGGSAALLAVTSAGRTPGQFAVSALGNASYQIPIWTPPGARGIEPKLALVYASGGPDGPLGPGWNLAGLSALARCAKTYASTAGSPAPIALTTSDDICLDGNRLRLISGVQLVAGSIYQTELASFSRVTAYGSAGNGPSYYVVEGKDGLLYEYGNSADSKAYATGSSTPYAWLLNKVRDRQLNNLVITYSTTNGDTQPATMSYTQTPATGTTYPYTVAFTYQNRVTNLNKYVSGVLIEQTKVLSKIDIRNSGVSVRQYNLTYATAPTTIRDRLVSIQECGGSSGTDCLRPTNVSYQNGSAGALIPTTSTGSGTTSGRANTVDLDGDGRHDLVYSTLSGSTYTWRVKFATSSGFGSTINTGVTTSATDPVIFDDFDGNGRVDLLTLSGGIWHVLRWNGSAFTWTSTGQTVDTGRPANANWDYVSADVNGDGLPDLVSARTDARLYTRLNTTVAGSVSFSTTVTMAYYAAAIMGGLWGNNSFPQSHVRKMDFNGDGRDDVVFLRGSPGGPVVVAVVSQGTTFVSGGLAGQSGSPITVMPANWNDDPCTDLIMPDGMKLAACNGAQGQVIPVPGWGRLAVDWDGDSRTDFLSGQTGNLMLNRSLGGYVASPVSTGIPVGSGSWMVFDQNADGLGDLGFINSAASNAITYSLHNGQATPADLATTIADGWGISASPIYVPITQNNYTKYSDATFPDFDFAGPLYVVSQAQHSDGIGGNYTNSFWYYGARINRQGRGLEGFHKKRAQDSRNGLFDETTYRRDYPYIGRVAQNDMYQSDGTSIITRTVNEFSAIDLAGAGCTSAISATNRCFPYVSRETVTTRELTAGTPLIHTAVTDVVVDGFGSPTLVTATLTDNDPASPFYNSVWQSVVTNVYLNDVTNWCLGKPTMTTTQNSVPNVPSATRRIDHTVDAVACRFDTETVEPLSPTQKVVTTFTYGTSACGNVSSESVVGLDKNGVAMAARVTSTNYGTRCQLPESITNPLNEVALHGFNYSYGVESSSTDANGVSVSWLYDNFGRRTRENRPDSTFTTWEYADCILATCWGASNLRLQVTENQYDATGGLVRSRQKFFDGLERIRFDGGHRVLGTWTSTQVVYNSLGLKQAVYQPYSTSSNGYHQFAYDVLNRPTSDTLYNSSGAIDRSTGLAYAGLKTTLTDAKGNSTQKWIDVTGKPRRIIDPPPGNGITNYVFDPFGNLVWMQDAVGAITTNTYNIRGFKTASSDPDVGTWTYTPDSLNELVAQTDNNSQTITFDYDKLGRLISRLEPESTTPTTWVYGTSAVLHDIGRLKSLSKPDGYTETYTFDAIGRSASVTYSADASFQVDYAYNSIGAVDTVTYPTSTSGYRFSLKYLYSFGFPQQVKDSAAGTVFWSLSSANDYSAPTLEILGNGASITTSHTPWTNDITTRQVGSGGSSTNLQNLAYSWDLNGNLQQRQDLAQSLTEAFTYDELNRLKTSTLNSVQNLSVSYNADGNITSKSDVGAYDYTTNQGSCSYAGLPTQPHAVRDAGGAVYCYDKNGNMTSRSGSTISWYSYNQPNSIVSGSHSSQFNYTPSYQRWKQVALESGNTTTTYYVGGILEKVIRPTGVTEYRHAIPAGSGMAIYTRRSNLTNSTYYVTSDHLGSGDLILDSAGIVLARESFTPFGERRGSNWQGVPSTSDKAAFADVTRRGFTGHEMLDAVNLIHMNGRVYDPRIGRFLSADPIVQSMSLSQALNPYSYVMNMPLTLTDPSGYSWLSKAFRSIAKFFKKFWKPILAIVLAIVTYGAVTAFFEGMNAALAAAMGLETAFALSITQTAIAFAASGMVAGAVMGGWKGALTGAISGALFGAVAGYFGSTWNAWRVAANGAAGGVSSEISGGSFVRGFGIALAVSFGQWAAVRMREAMWRQSLKNPDNSSGESAGWHGDQHKLAGSRVSPNKSTYWKRLLGESTKGSPFGGHQGGKGYFFGDDYAVGSWRDNLFEAYAGPHDGLSSNWYSSATGNIMKMNWLEQQLFGLQSVFALVPATAVVAADVVPSIYFGDR